MEGFSGLGFRGLVLRGLGFGAMRIAWFATFRV